VCNFINVHIFCTHNTIKTRLIEHTDWLLLACSSVLLNRKERGSLSILHSHDYTAQQTGPKDLRIIRKYVHSMFELNGVIRRPMEGHRPRVNLTRFYGVFAQQ
jgi:hypothetical protein